MTDNQDEPRLETPGVSDILRLTDTCNVATGEIRTAVLDAMRKAADKRVAGVTKNKRRRHYGHAAQLVVIRASLDDSIESTNWVSAIRDAYRRYPAFERKLVSNLGRAS